MSIHVLLSLVVALAQLAASAPLCPPASDRNDAGHPAAGPPRSVAGHHPVWEGAATSADSGARVPHPHDHGSARDGDDLELIATCPCGCNAGAGPANAMPGQAALTGHRAAAPGALAITRIGARRLRRPVAPSWPIDHVPIPSPAARV